MLHFPDAYRRPQPEKYCMANPVTVSSPSTSASRRLWLALFSVALLGGCSSLYFDAMEKLGFEKRDILVDRVENARDSQNDAQETFRSSLERFQSVVDTLDTELKEQYAEISDAYEESRSSAEKSASASTKWKKSQTTCLTSGKMNLIYTRVPRSGAPANSSLRRPAPSTTS